jgi:hypothetical protein
LLHYVIALLVYGAITGLASAVLAHKSQIESWAIENPKRAGALKILRGVGLDPWNVISGVSLWAKGKLPDAQQNGAKAVAQFKAASVAPPPLTDADDTPPTRMFPPSVPPVIGFLAMLCFAFHVNACGLFAAAAPYLAEAAVLIADATNAVDAAESTHLIDPELIARARAALAAAAAADDGAKDLTAEQLDASLVAFRAAWADIQKVYAAKRVGAAAGAPMLPMPLAVRRAQK